MKTVELKGQWNQVKGKVKQQWGKITDDDLSKLEGRKDELVGLIQQRYGKTAQQAQQEVDDFLKSCNC